MCSKLWNQDTSITLVHLQFRTLTMNDVEKPNIKFWDYFKMIVHDHPFSFGGKKPSYHPLHHL